MKKSLEELNTAWSNVSQEMYKKSQQENPVDADASNAKSNNNKDEVKDADYEVVDEEKKE